VEEYEGRYNEEDVGDFQRDGDILGALPSWDVPRHCGYGAER
jgi:hypothetical protein